MAGAALPTTRPDEQLKTVMPGPPVALRTFPQNDELTVFAEVYDNEASKPHKVDIATTITSGSGGPPRLAVPAFLPLSNDPDTVAALANERVYDFPDATDRLVSHNVGVEHVWVAGTAIRRHGHDVDATPGVLISF